MWWGEVLLGLAFLWTRILLLQCGFEPFPVLPSVPPRAVAALACGAGSVLAPGHCRVAEQHSTSDQGVRRA